MDPTNCQDFTPRPYQIYLFEKAVAHNSIIKLPTGTGKTFIAVLLIKHLSKDLKLPYKDGGKRTVFIVNTVSLVHQQSTFLNRHTGLMTKGYTGEMNVDFWSEEEWNTEIESNQVLVMTAQIFLNLIEHGILPLKKVNLLIFDECHRAVNNHPMRQIMQRFEGCPDSQQPRVLGMSASLLNSNVKLDKISKALRELEVTFQAKIITVESIQEVKNFATKPKEYIEKYASPEKIDVLPHIEEIIKHAQDIITCINIPNAMVNPLTSKEFKPDTKNAKLTRILSDLMEHLNEMGLWGGNKGVLLHLIQLELIKQYSDEPQVIQILEFVATQCIKIQKILTDRMGNLPCKDTIEKYSSPKVLKLVSVLKEFHKRKDPNDKFCCIIFVKRRFTAKILYHILKKLSEYDEGLKFLKPDFMVGYNNDPYKNARELLCITKWNKTALNNFRNGSVNTLIATDVIDEGVDIPSCTLIVRYYAPPDFRSWVQSKGRARHASSVYIILIEDEEYKQKHDYFTKTQTYLEQSLHGENFDKRCKPSSEEIKAELYDHIIQPFEIIKEDGTKSIITALNAVSTINYYCATLIKSKFITLTPAWIKLEDTEETEKYKVVLSLPPASPLREEIIGDAFSSLDDAKRSAAVKACIRLYQIGQLDENLMPLKVEDSVKLTKNLFPYLPEKKEDNSRGIPGTTTKKRRHKLVFPEQLSEAYPINGKICYLHVLNIKPIYSEPDDNRNKVFYDLLNSNSNFGILSAKKLPQIPSFPIFMNVGELQVNVITNNKVQTLEKPQVDSLKIFHTLIFNEITPVIKDFMVFDSKNLENSFLIVPTIGTEINWTVVDNRQKIEYIPPSMYDFSEVNDKDFLLALIRPTYRGSNVYIVTQVCEYLKANSRFPTADFDSYVHYYNNRHELKIENENQPLLEVKQISNKINCIKPRSISRSLSKRKRENLTEDFEEHLVPELCEKINFNSTYWLKATTLASIIHRISQLLNAENLLRKIAHEADLNIQVGSEHMWDPLIIDEKRAEISTKKLNCYEETELEDISGYYDDDIDLESADSAILEVDVLSREDNIYSWQPEEEPPDIVRNADCIEQIDIKRYYQFISKETPKDREYLLYQNIPIHYMSVENIPVPEIKMLNLTNEYGPGPADILLSLTAKSCNDYFNSERPETLGDSFLKLAVSLFLHIRYPDFGEGPLSYLKGKLVGNLNLFYCAKVKDIPGRMNIEEFTPYLNFVAPCYSAERRLQRLLNDHEVSANILYDIHIPQAERFSGKISNSTIASMQEKVLSWDSEIEHPTGMEQFLGHHIVSDKTISDCVEALIGTYLLHLGIEGAVKILKFFEILPQNSSMHELFYTPVPDPKIGLGDVNDYLSLADNIEQTLKYKFNNRAFLLQAFTHPSYALNSLTASYQRLEFLGDAVLDFLLTAFIYENCGNLSPGELTDLRAALVNNITFACLSVRYGLHTALLQHAPKLFELIDRFVKFQENRDYVVNDELLWILLEEDDCNMAEHVDVPKVLGDIFESVIGAIFLDSNKNLQTTWEVIYRLMHKEINLFKLNVPKQPIRVIYETQGANPKFSKTTKVENNAVMVTLSISCNVSRKIFHGFGSTKKLAKCAASKQAIKYLRYKR